MEGRERIQVEVVRDRYPDRVRSKPRLRNWIQFSYTVAGRTKPLLQTLKAFISKMLEGSQRKEQNHGTPRRVRDVTAMPIASPQKAALKMSYKPQTQIQTDITVFEKANAHFFKNTNM